jgi:hypothetical protein
MLVMGDRRHRDDFAIIAGDRTCPLQDRDRHPVEIGGQFGKGKCMRRKASTVRAWAASKALASGTIAPASRRRRNNGDSTGSSPRERASTSP